MSCLILKDRRFDWATAVALDDLVPSGHVSLPLKTKPDLSFFRDSTQQGLLSDAAVL